MTNGMFKVTYIKGELIFNVEKLKLLDKLNKTYQLRKYLIDHGRNSRREN
jgi:hypothetical protein